MLEAAYRWRKRQRNQNCQQQQQKYGQNLKDQPDHDERSHHFYNGANRNLDPGGDLVLVWLMIGGADDLRHRIEIFVGGVFGRRKDFLFFVSG